LRHGRGENPELRAENQYQSEHEQLPRSILSFQFDRFDLQFAQKAPDSSFLHPSAGLKPFGYIYEARLRGLDQYDICLIATGSSFLCSGQIDVAQRQPASANLRV